MDGVLRSAKVPGSMLVFGVVAAAHVAALLANAQVHPGVVQGHALGAYVLVVLFEMAQVEGSQVLAGSVHSKQWKRWRRAGGSRATCAKYWPHLGKLARPPGFSQYFCRTAAKPAPFCAIYANY
jgi:hypothetical protein